MPGQTTQTELGEARFGAPLTESTLTCADLGWRIAPADSSICATAEVNLVCQSQKYFGTAKSICESVGARLCKLVGVDKLWET